MSVKLDDKYDKANDEGLAVPHLKECESSDNEESDYKDGGNAESAMVDQADTGLPH